MYPTKNKDQNSVVEEIGRDIFIDAIADPEVSLKREREPKNLDD